MTGIHRIEGAPGARVRFDADGFVHIRGVAVALIQDLRDIVDAAIPEMAAELGVTEERYVEVVSAWGLRSTVVQSLLRCSVDALRPWVTALCTADGVPVDATLFVKSERAGAETHAHQDIGYRWNQPNRYTITTWVALDDTNASTGALSLLPGSHREEISVRQDFLAADFRDRSTTEEWSGRAVTVNAKAGDVIVFDARTWHAAHPFTGQGVRRAFAVRWNDRALSATLAIPPPTVDPRRFGMDTSGQLLIEAISNLLGDRSVRVDTDLSAAVDALLHWRACAAIPLAPEAWEVIERLRLGLHAADTQHGRPYGPLVWEPIRDLVLPALTAANIGQAGGGGA